MTCAEYDIIEVRMIVAYAIAQTEFSENIRIEKRGEAR